MASLKDIKRQITAIKNTQKLTKAMNMVAASKLRGTQGRTESFRAYAMAHHRLMHEIGGRCSDIDHPLMKEDPQAKKVIILAFSSDRGLCGSFNTNLYHELDKKIISLREEGLEPSLFLVGRKLREYYQRRKVHINHAMVNVMSNFDYSLARDISEAITKLFLEGGVKEVCLLTTRFISVAKQEPVMMQFLPLISELHHGKGVKSSSASDYLVEPDPATLFTRLIPRSLAISVYQSMLESVTSENAARMQAMDNASKNCKEITESLTLVHNKIRQAAVTNELLDIVNGSEALAKG